MNNTEYIYRAHTVGGWIDGPTPHDALARLRERWPSDDPATFRTELLSLLFWCEGDAKSRQSISTVTRGGKTWGYHDDQAGGWKDRLHAAARNAILSQPCTPALMPPSDHPCEVVIVFGWPIPQRRNRPCMPGSPMGVRPDLDNLEKPLFDALRAAGLFFDDARVFSKSVSKVYAEKPGVLVKVRWDTDQPEISKKRAQR